MGWVHSHTKMMRNPKTTVENSITSYSGRMQDCYAGIAANIQLPLSFRIESHRLLDLQEISY